MRIEKNLAKIGIQYHTIKLKQSTDSDAVRIPEKDYFSMSVVLTVTGSAILQYSLGVEEEVLNDTALWHNWSAGEVSETTGFSFNSPISYIRILSSSEYTLEIKL